MVDPKEIKELKKAIIEGDEKKVRNLLKKSPDLASDWRPVLEAAKLGRVEIMQSLIDHYADVDAVASVGGWRPLHRAIWPRDGVEPGPGHRAVIELLLKFGADIEARGTPYRLTPLATAAVAGDKEQVKLLTAKGAKVTLFTAAVSCQLKKVKELLKDDKELLHSRDVNGWTVLHYCAASGLGATDSKVSKELGEMARFLVEKGIDPKTEADTMGKLLSPLRLAVNNLAVAGYLLELKVDPNQKDAEGRTVLHETAASGDFPETIALLLKCGADPGLKDSQERTALDVAQEKKHIKVIKALGGVPPPSPTEVPQP